MRVPRRFIFGSAPHIRYSLAGCPLGQRTATMRHLRDLTRLKGSADDDLAWELVVESLVFQAEAEIRWLDHVEASVLRTARTVGAQGRTPSAAQPAARDRQEARR